MLSTKPPTPTLDRILVLTESGELAVITDFLEWLYDETGYLLGVYKATARGDKFVPAPIGIRALLADFFKIDLAEENTERETLLSWVRAQQEKER